MTIKIFNTINRKKEIFKPVKPDSVSMYVCGPTVYSHPHIGNARAALVPDILFRLLKKKYNDVTYIRNITDVDDKISDAALKQNKTVYEISEKFIKIYQDNMASLDILEPTYQPRVTDNMPGIISTIEKILQNGFAYISENHVLFDTSKYKNYGELSKRALDEMIDGARIEIADYKKSPRDFILWKPSDNNQPGWESPWGLGRPGWHIECTSMIKNIIGNNNTLDLHGGGNDLIFPHHENEIAQGSCMSSSKYCNYWFHNGIVLVNKKKMSKSLGNVILLEDLLQNNKSNSIRLALLSAHYRQPLNWSDSTLIESNNLIKKFSSLARLFVGEINKYNNLDNEIIDILSDDLNTPEAVKYLSKLSKTAKINQKDLASLIVSAKFIGINLLAHNTSALKTIDEELVKSLIEERFDARSSGDFKKADEIRDKLLSMGILIKDLEDKTVWDYNPDN
jgi:cysteinyl-tRNA synthetase